MDWLKIETHFADVVALAADKNGTPVSPILADTMRDTIHAMKNNVTEFGGLEAVCAAAIREFDAPKKPEPEAPKTKRGK